MIDLRKLTSEGNQAFLAWLQSGETGDPPVYLLNDPNYTEPVPGLQVDETRVFGNQFEFGQYLNSVFQYEDFSRLTAEESDGIWNWLSIVYFRQLAPSGRKKYWRYFVTRRGAVGSLSYRQIPRTAYEQFHVHGENSRICLASRMHLWPDIAEQLTSRQGLAYNKGFFEAASSLFLNKGKLRRGAASKPKKKSLRKAGDRTGHGSVRRLATALERLDLTYDTESMSSADLISVLPREFNKWTEGS